MYHRLCLIFLLMVLPAYDSAPVESVQKKVQAIEHDHWPPSEAISFSSQELVALGMDGVNTSAPGTVTQPRLTLERDAATATAIIDFDRLRQESHADESSGAWLYSRFITGKHPVSVSVQVQSAAGEMTVHPVSVSISGITISGSGLEFLLNTFVLPRYPDAVIDRPFPLRYNIDRIQVNPGNALVIRKRKVSVVYLFRGLFCEPHAVGNANAIVGIAHQEQSRLGPYPLPNAQASP
jgi:hypothetical protein